MITVTFQFNTIEAAQEFLDDVKVASFDPRGNQLPQADVQPVREDGKKERKSRSDAGQPRGPYKKKGEDSPVASEAAAPATVPAETPPAAPEAAAPAPVADKQSLPSALTLADVRAAMTGRSTEKNIALLKKFGYAKSSDLPAEKYAEFIAACKRGE